MMSIRNARGSNGRPGAKFGVESPLVIATLVVPIIGTFFPIENYLNQKAFLVKDATLTSDSIFSSGTAGVIALYAIYGCLMLKLRFSERIAALLRMWPLVLFLLIAAMSANWGVAPTLSLNRTIRLGSMLIAAMFVVQRYDAAEITKLVTYSFFIFAAGSVAVAILVPSFGVSQLPGQASNWTGATSNKNTLGGLACVGAIFAFYCYYIGEARRIALATLAMCVLLLWKSSSATGVASTAIAGGVGLYFAIVAMIRSPVWKLGTLCAGALALCAFAFVATSSDFIFDLLGRDSSLTGRSQVWAVVNMAIEQSPWFGYGHGFWISNSPALTGIWNYLNWATPEAHNMWLDIWLQLGLFGLIPFILILARTAFDGLYVVSFSSARGSIIWIALLCAFCLRGVSETQIVDPGINWMFWFALPFGMLTKARTAISHAAAHRMNMVPRPARPQQAWRVGGHMPIR